jgi:hypothetical protein
MEFLSRNAESVLVSGINNEDYSVRVCVIEPPVSSDVNLPPEVPN